MPDDGRERELRSGPSPGTRRWTAWRDEAQAAAAADRQSVVKARAAQKRRAAHETRSPIPVGAGLLAALLLLIAGWFIFDRMHCDPFYADVGMSRRQMCR